MMENPGATDLVSRLNRLHPKVIDLSLGRIERLLERLGNPQDKLPPVIHIAGTNGKGSVIAFIRAIAEASGWKVHAYTSPHLVHFNERICLAGRDINDGELLALIEECEDVNGDAPITFFEITTAVAFLAFSRSPANLVLLETGLGGRLDATNVIARPAMTALTPISIDHEGFLGSSLEGIAAEKAGILKANTPCIMAAQSDDAAAIIRDRAKSLGAPLIEQGAGWSYEDLGGAFSVATGLRKMNLPLPSLTGAHQIANAAQAVTIFDHVAVPMAAENIIGKGLAAARWPARLQQLKIGPLLAHLPQGWELWLDGGHNAAAGKILATQAEQWSDKPLYLISGVLNTKDAGAIFRPLAPFVKKLSALRIPNEEASLSADELAALAGIGGMTCQTAATVSDALQKIIDDEKLPSRILICGSLYLAGQVLAENG